MTVIYQNIIFLIKASLSIQRKTTHIKEEIHLICLNVRLNIHNNFFFLRDTANFIKTVYISEKKSFISQPACKEDDSDDDDDDDEEMTIKYAKPATAFLVSLSPSAAAAASAARYRRRRQVRVVSQGLVTLVSS
jgi:hypothetical protein